ncbi:MAG: O-antigen ligase family protein, partial [Chloroflexi bacterium]|nr:O-antigen ligase family protein [Chloroflexota bacterium]
AVLAFIVGQLPWFPVTPAPIDAQVGGVLIFIIVTLLFLLTAHQITNITWLKWITFLFIGFGGFYLLRPIVPGMVSATEPLFSSRVGGSIFYIWLTAMSLSQALYNKQLSRPWRILLAAVTVLLLYNVLFITRSWVSGWLPSLIALFVVIWAGSPRTAYIIIGVAAVFLFFRSQALLGSFLYIGDNQYSQITRFEAWRIIGEIVKVNPILGLGPANYSFYTPLFPILGWFVKFNSHNNYVDMIAQTGILGLTCLLWFFWEMGKILLRLRNQVSGNGFVQAYIYAAVGGFAATIVAGMFGDWIIPYVYNVTIRGLRSSMYAWLFLGGIIAIDWLLKSGKLDIKTGQEIYDDL